MGTDTYTIGEFARLTGLTEKALRLYDSRGLLPPAEVDPDTGYRHYGTDQVDLGRLVATLRAIDMPLADIAEVVEAQPEDRSRLVAAYWYRVERELDDRRLAAQRARGIPYEDGGRVSSGSVDGALAAIERLAGVADIPQTADAFHKEMRTAYWDDKDLARAMALAYAGVGRLLAAAAAGNDPDDIYAARSGAKALVYDLASFTWVGWDETGIEVSSAQAEAGLTAARLNLRWAEELDKPDLARSRAHWMLGAQLLTAGAHQEAEEAFTLAGHHARRAGAAGEADLAEAFAALARRAGGVEDGSLERAMERLAAGPEGEGLVSQLTTARRVLGL